MKDTNALCVCLYLNVDMFIFNCVPVYIPCLGRNLKFTSKNLRKNMGYSVWLLPCMKLWNLKLSRKKNLSQKIFTLLHNVLFQSMCDHVIYTDTVERVSWMREKPSLSLVNIFSFFCQKSKFFYSLMPVEIWQTEKKTMSMTLSFNFGYNS